MNTTIAHARRALLMGLTCGVVLVSSSGALGEDGAGEARQQVRNRNDSANGQGERNENDPIAQEFEGILTYEHLLKLRLMELRQKFQPGHPQCRRLEAQLDSLNKQKTELLQEHPALLRQHEDRREAEEKLRALRAEERLLQGRVDELKEEQELLLKKHPELRGR